MEATVAKNKKEIAREKVFVDIPQSDMFFLQLFAEKMGWSVNNKARLWDEYLANSPQSVALSEEEVMNEVRAVRYGAA